ncbi:Ig gamma-3 chain C region [Galemys pyrenaicus]|uniref:Ig gamma-3 chain C region n=1 Tax=Galemys pyrenaicus TaxID=202257 RepID=A0A8J6AEH7_GALPY|nr:Ig gamma-3 chain C region [Galemys pyrenaicus]
MAVQGRGSRGRATRGGAGPGRGRTGGRRVRGARPSGQGLAGWGVGAGVRASPLSPAASTTAPKVFPLAPACGTTSSSSVVLGCLVSSYFPEPVTVSWKGSPQTGSPYTFPAVTQSSGLHTLSSMVTVPAGNWPRGSYSCHVDHKPSKTAVEKRIGKRTGPGLPPRPVRASGLPAGRAGPWARGGRWSWGRPELAPPKPGEGTSRPLTPLSFQCQGSRNRVRKAATAKVSGGASPRRVTRAGGRGGAWPGADGAVSPGDLLGGPSAFIFPPKPKDTLMISGKPEVTCVVVDVRNENPEVTFNWYVDNKEVQGAVTKSEEEQYNSTVRVVSALRVQHQDWLDGKEYKCKINNKDLPGPIQKTISKTRGTPHKPQVYTLAPDPEELSQSKASITCLVRGFYPSDVYVEWQKNNQPLPEGSYHTTPPQEDGEGTFFLYSMLRVDTSAWKSGQTFTCHVMHEALHNHATQKTISKSAEVLTDNCEDAQDEELDGLWTTLSIFITLFLLSVSYSAAVTLFKVKWIFSSVVELKRTIAPDYRNMIGQGA